MAESGFAVLPRLRAVTTYECDRTGYAAARTAVEAAREPRA